MARYDDDDDEWPAYVPVAERRRRAEREAVKLHKGGHPVAPVRIEGRVIATTVWGKAWCDNLESYRDYESRLPRGRTYVRNGSVIDLQIGLREVKALVSGSSIYKVTIGIAPVPAAQWRSICTDCAGQIDSLVELLQGRLSKGVMERICRQGTGLFPKPSDIKFSCRCLDFASMCKHVAAVLYGVGARLDRSPELLFRMRAVDESELLAGLDRAVLAATLPEGRVLAGEDIAALFGLDITGSDDTNAKISGRLSHPPPVSDAAASSPPKQTAGRSRPMPPKKMPPTAPSAPAKGAQPRVPTEIAGPRRPAAGKSVVTQRLKPGTPGNMHNETPKIAAVGLAARAQPGTRTAKASSASVGTGQAEPSGQAAKGALAPGRATVSRQHPNPRLAVAQTVRAPAGPNEQGEKQALEAVLARLEEISRGLGEIGQLRADVQRLSVRFDELAAAAAGQGQAPAEDAASAAPKRDPEPKQTSRKEPATQALLPAELGGISDRDRNGIGEGNVVGHGRDPGDAVPPGVAVQTPAPLRSEDKAALDALNELPRRVVRSKGRAGGQARK